MHWSIQAPQVQPIIDEAVYRPSSALPGAVPQFTTGVCECECERAITRAETRRAGDLCVCVSCVVCNPTIGRQCAGDLQRCELRARREALYAVVQSFFCDLPRRRVERDESLGRACGIAARR